MIKFIQKIFGSKHDKDIKILEPLIEEINELFAEYSSLNEEQLRSKTAEFKAVISNAVADLLKEEEELRTELQSENLDHEDKESHHERLREIAKEKFATINSTLDDLLPEAFAVVKEVCRRLKGKKYSVVGNENIWDMIPYDVQLMGGIVLHQGKIAEMATGEGKTLVAVLPLYLNALAGYGVHLITVNDYLARRDREWMLPVFDYLGISTGCIQSNMDPELRKVEYQKDITYGTNNEFGFDYLRDNMVVELSQMVQRDHWYAVVDEVDSVLVDEARTPLIISGPVMHSSEQKYDIMNPRVKRLVDTQSRMVNQLVADVEKLLKTGKKEDKEQAGIALLRSYRAFPKHSRLTKVLQDPENLKLMKETELEYLKDQGMKMLEIDAELYYTIDERNHQIDLTEKGRTLMTGINEDPDLFIVPDVATGMVSIENDKSLTAEEKQLKKDELIMLFSERTDVIHTVSQLLRAYSLYVRDVEYIVEEGKVKIVDEHTGRVLDGRRYSDGLHQAIEAKEQVLVEKDTQTFATITLQNYFRMYNKLAGMTGTAETEAAEFEKIYNLDVVVVPTNRKAVRKDLDDLIYRTKREKYNAVIEEVQKLVKEQRAVLVGTTSVEVSELLSKMLKRVNVNHNVLNAKQHQREAEIVLEAGRAGAVTIATNMAGRGTDIKIDEIVRKTGGLAIVGTERHDSRRIDRQLRGRSGRQGDPGSSQFFLSFEDNLMRLYNGERIGSLMQSMKVPEGEALTAGIVTKSIERAQKKVEENNFGIRKRLIEYDNVMNQQREVIYTRRRQAIEGERMKSELFSYIEDYAHDVFDAYNKDGDYEGMLNDIRVQLFCEPAITNEEFKKISVNDFVQKVIEAASEFYKRKEERIGSEFLAHLERVAILQTIDDKWREHLRVMDDLKEGIHLRAYGQKDPLLEYKGEAYRIFVELLSDINKESVHFAFKYFPQVVEKEVRTSQAAPENAQRNSDGLPTMRNVTVMNSPSLKFSRPTPSYAIGNPEVQEGQHEPIERSQPGQTIRNSTKVFGRNDPCPMDAKKKFKNCCGATGEKTCIKMM
jgi:preprotein translocase subunit SecA